ncbi:MAG: hypothetical protein IJZ79_02245 [Bacilli bacterium]|nr:hypothetical protein [Bacilli bacterium]
MERDSGVVIKHKNKKLYYCGLSTWDSQLRKAKIYHSKKFAEEAMESSNRFTKDELILVPVVIYEEENTNG